MAKIIATGTFGVNEHVVVCEEIDDKIRVTFDGEENTLFRKVLEALLDVTMPMGGTYYPERGTMLAYYHVLNTVYFGKLLDLKTEGDIGQIPYEDGVVY